jgi:alpha-tubulin suppressor-like RCC1 family protein
MHVLALDLQGGVWTWGGKFVTAAERPPHQVVGVSNAVAISASQLDKAPAGAAVLVDGSLWMWGDEGGGQLGVSGSANVVPPFMVSGVTNAKSVAMGYSHVLLLIADGTLLTRGGPALEVSGYWGELGDGTMTPHYDFQPVTGLPAVVEVAAGAHTSHVKLSDGSIRAWGQNSFGSLGDGTTTDSPSPVVVQLAK